MNYDYPFNKFLKDIGPEKEKPSWIFVDFSS